MKIYHADTSESYPNVGRSSTGILFDVLRCSNLVRLRRYPTSRNRYAQDPAGVPVSQKYRGYPPLSTESLELAAGKVVVHYPPGSRLASNLLPQA